MYFDKATLAQILAVTHDPRHIDLRRIAVMDTLVGVFSAIHAVNKGLELVDGRRFPAYHDIDVGEPIYIVAAPRSGTTFFHRLMSLDPTFATFTLFQTIFPSITASEVAEKVMASRGPISKITDKVTNTIDEGSFGGWEGMHDTGLDQDEEDEAIWALFLATPAVLLLLPFPERFEHLRFVDRLPDEKKQRIVDGYRECLQRRLHRHPGKTLLMKNVLLPGRYELVTRAAPRARFVHIVRHPYEAIASSLSLFTLPWTVMAREAYGPTEKTLDFANLLIDYYRFFYERERESLARADGRFVSLQYRDLVAEPLTSLKKVYSSFDLPFDAGLESRFGAELSKSADFKSTHDYSLEGFGLTREYIAERLGDVMDYYGFER